MGGIQFFVKTNQTGWVIQHPHPGPGCMLQHKTGMEEALVDRGILTHPDHVEVIQRDCLRGFGAAPVARPFQHGQGCGKPHNAVALDKQIVNTHIEERGAPILGGAHHRQRGILGWLDAGDGIHHNANFQGFIFFGSHRAKFFLSN